MEHFIMAFQFNRLYFSSLFPKAILIHEAVYTSVYIFDTYLENTIVLVFTVNRWNILRINFKYKFKMRLVKEYKILDLNLYLAKKNLRNK